MAPRWRKTVQESPKIALHGPNMDPRRLKRGLRRETFIVPAFLTFFMVQEIRPAGQTPETPAEGRPARRNARTAWEASLMILRRLSYR